jgi:RND superfamily putative drug exporter
MEGIMRRQTTAEESRRDGARGETPYRAPLTGRVARYAATNPKRVIAGWGVLLAATVGVIMLLLGSGLTTDVKYRASTPDSVAGVRLLEDKMTGPTKATEIIIVRSDSSKVTDPAFKTYVGDLAARIRGLGRSTVSSTATYYQTKDATQVSKDKHATLILVTLADEPGKAADYVDKLHTLLVNSQSGGFTTQQTGDASMGEAAMKLSASDLGRAEIFGMPAAMFILLIVFGAVVAAGMPLLLAGIAIMLAFGLTALVGTGYQVSVFAINVITMMGLAVGIDYTLFIISRLREERARGLSKIDAIVTTYSTAGRAIMFSGLTVMIAMLGMTVAPVDITISLGLGAILVVMSTLVAALVLLPAVLSLLGDRVNSLRIPGLARLHRRSDARGRFWEKLAHSIMRRPLPYLLIAAVVLIACATPTLLMKTGNLQAGAGTYPDRLYPKQGWNALDRQFSLGKAAPVQIVVDGQASSAAVQGTVKRLQASLAADGHFGPAQVSVGKAGDLTLINTGLTGDPAGDAAQAVVKHLRDDLIPAAVGSTDTKVYVTGTTGFVVDYLAFFNVWLPIAIVLVLALSFVLMLLAFRSIVIAAKTILLNLLSVGAAYGLMVLVFQKGVGAHLLGFNQVDRIEAWVPLVLFSMLFGLSMDYQVFLLSRIKERYDQTGDTREAVAHGIGRTAGIITGAAAIMVVVFAGVASGELVMFQQMGFGLAVAIFIDATIVRTILVPAAMELLGDWNWYLPRWLEWLPRVEIDGAAEAYEPEPQAQSELAPLPGVPAPEATPQATPAGGYVPAGAPSPGR